MLLGIKFWEKNALVETVPKDTDRPWPLVIRTPSGDRYLDVLGSLA